jgi:pimeloyl-ACP methyl ester carboxylesterase
MHGALNGVAIEPPMRQAELAILPHRPSDRVQVALIARASVRPATRIEQKARFGARGHFAQAARHRREQFQPGRRQQTAQTKLRDWRGRASQEQCTRLVTGQAGEIGAIAIQELVAAPFAALTKDGHAGCAQILPLLSGMLPRSRVLELDTGHWPMLSQPAQIAQLLGGLR